MEKKRVWSNNIFQLPWLCLTKIELYRREQSHFVSKLLRNNTLMVFKGPDSVSDKCGEKLQWV